MDDFTLLHARCKDRGGEVVKVYGSKGEDAGVLLKHASSSSSTTHIHTNTHTQACNINTNGKRAFAT